MISGFRFQVSGFRLLALSSQLSALSLALCLALSAAAQQATNVQKGGAAGANALTGDLVLPALRTLTLSGIVTGTPASGTLNLSNLTLTLPAATSALFQPVDSDLTAIAALSTTANGRSLLTATALTAAGLSLTNGAAIDSWGAITRASGYDTFATTPSGANLASLLTTALPASKGGTGLTALSANVVSYLGAADYSAMRTQLGLVIGTNVQAYDADLDSIAANATGGFLTRTAANTYTPRTITGTAGQIVVTNGDGVAGVPTLSLATTITQNTVFSNGLVASLSTEPFRITGTTGVTYQRFVTTGGNYYLGVSSSTGTGLISGAGNYSLALLSETANNLAFGTNNTLRLLIDGTTGAATFTSGSVVMSGASGSNALTIDNSTSTTRLTTSFGGSSLAIRVNAVGADQFALSGSALTLGTSTPLVVNSTTASTSTTTGSATFGGGLGVAGALFGTSANFTGPFITVNNTVASGLRGITLQTSGSDRWKFGENGTAEAGSNAGSDFQISAYTDAGAFSSTPFSITRSNGNVALASTTEATTVGAGSLTTAGGIYAAKKVVTISDYVTARAADTTQTVTVSGGDASFSYVIGSGVKPLRVDAGANALHLATNATNRVSVAVTTGDMALASTTEATTGGAGSLSTVGGIYAAKKIYSATNILSIGATAGIGYDTGAGGTVTQITSRTTGVTLNKVTGAITLVSAAGSTSWQSFTVTNSAVAATDTIVLNQVSGTDLYRLHVTAVGAGSFQITYATTAGTTTEQPVIRFTVIKSVSS